MIEIGTLNRINIIIYVLNIVGLLSKTECLELLQSSDGVIS